MGTFQFQDTSASLPGKPELWANKHTEFPSDNVKKKSLIISFSPSPCLKNMEHYLNLDLAQAEQNFYFSPIFFFHFSPIFSPVFHPTFPCLSQQSGRGAVLGQAEGPETPRSPLSLGGCLGRTRGEHNHGCLLSNFHRNSSVELFQTWRSFIISCVYCPSRLFFWKCILFSLPNNFRFCPLKRPVATSSTTG